ncbi:hypothetical protein AUJ63_00875 [Candidatus Pacearchaeota archaeon CG1_02_35_32]|nr:MAG: hypothetical protein AUJ63_00875 [Candidatus Pacearchaeota archaeon CG1_02_35_32]
MIERLHVIKLLKQAKKAALDQDVLELKSLSDQTIHSVSIYQDEDNMLAAIFIYALAKLIERKEKYSGDDFAKYLKLFLHAIDNSISCIDKDFCEEFKGYISSMLRESEKLPGEFKEDVKFVFRKARINKASKVYEHGISMEKTAKLLGISQWELAEYVGPMGASEYPQSRTLDVKKRVKRAMEFFE